MSRRSDRTVYHENLDWQVKTLIFGSHHRETNLWIQSLHLLPIPITNQHITSNNRKTGVNVVALVNKF